MTLAFFRVGVLGIPVTVVSFDVVLDVDMVRVARGSGGAFLVDSDVDMARCKALWVWVVALTCGNAARGGSKDNIWWSFLQVVKIPSTVAMRREEEPSSLPIIGDGEKILTRGMRVPCRGAGERSMLEAAGMARPPSQLMALGRSMSIV